MIDLHRILVPTDFSKHSLYALTYAVALAERFDAELCLLHVVQDLAVLIPDMIAVGPPVAPTVADLTAGVQGAFDRLVAEHRLDRFRLRRELREGDPPAEIVRFASEAEVDLVVMATHGYSGLTHALLGSVAERVVRKAPCPVLTVRHPEHEFVRP